MKFGCHSFGGMHAIFSMYGTGLRTRLSIIKRAMFTPGIIGYVYYSGYGVSKELENEIEHMGNYGIVHGQMNFEQHNCYRNEDEPLNDEVTEKLKADIAYYTERKKEIEQWYEWNSERINLAIDSTKQRLKDDGMTKNNARVRIPDNMGLFEYISSLPDDEDDESKELKHV